MRSHVNKHGGWGQRDLLDFKLILMSPNGHKGSCTKGVLLDFWVNARVNGPPNRFVMSKQVNPLVSLQPNLY